MENPKTQPDDSLIPGDMVEFLWTQPQSAAGDVILWGQVEDIRDDAKQLTVAVYDDTTDAFEHDVPLFRLKWNSVEGRYEGKKV